MAEDIIFTLGADGSSAFDVLAELLQAVEAIGEALGNVASALAVFDDLGTSLGTVAANAAVANDGLGSLNNDLAQSVSLGTQMVQTVDAQTAAIEANVQALQQSAQANADEEELTQILLEQQQSLTQVVQEETGALTQLVLPFSDIDATVSSLNDDTNYLIKSMDTLDQVFANGLMSEEEYASFADTLGISLTEISDAANSDIAPVDALGTLLDGLTGQTAGVTLAMESLQTAWVDGIASNEEYMSGITVLRDQLVTLQGQTANVVLQIDALNEAEDAAAVAAASVVQALSPQVAVFADLEVAAQGGVAALSWYEQENYLVSNAVADNVNWLTAFDQLVAEVTDSDVSLAEGLSLIAQAAFGMGGNFADAAVAMAQFTANTVTAIAASVNTSTSFTTVDEALGALQSSFLSTTAAIGEFGAGLVAAFTGEQQATVKTVELTAAQKQLQASSSGSYFGEMMLAGMAVMVAGGFLQMGMSAQDAISKISGLADQFLSTAAGATQMNSVVNQLSADSIKFGINLTDAANGMYYIMSAGFKTSDALTLLNYSMEASAATGAKMSDISNALTSILNAYGLSAAHAGVITNQMVAAVVAGKTDFTLFANSIGPVAASAAHAGISFNQAAAALATISEINPRVRQDGANLANMFDVLSLKTSTIAAHAASLGINFSTTAFQSDNLMQKLQYLSRIAGGDTTPAFASLMTNATATKVAFDLLSRGGTMYGTILNSVTNNTQALATAFAAAQQTLSQSLNVIGAALSVIAYKIVVMITPAAQVVLQAFGAALGFLSQHMELLIPVITTLAVLLGGVLIVALVGVAGFFGSMISSVTLIIIPIALVIGVIVAFILQLHNLAQTSPIVQTAFGQIGNALSGTVRWFENIGNYISANFMPEMRLLGTFFATIGNTILSSIMPPLGQLISQFVLLGNRVLAGVIPALQQFGGFINSQVLPPLLIIMTNVAKFAGVLVAQLEPGLNTAGTALMRVGGYILQNVLPPIGALIANVLHVAAVISGNLGPVMTQLGNIFLVVRAVVIGIGAAFTAYTLVLMTIFLPALIEIVTTFLVGLIPSMTAAIALAVTGTVAFIAMNAPFIILGAIVALVVIGLIKLLGPLGVLGAIATVAAAGLRTVWEAIVSALGPVLQQLWTTIQTQLVPAWMHLMTALTPLLPVIEGLGVLVLGVIIVAFGLLIGIIVGVVRALGQFLTGMIQLIGGVIQVVSGIVQVFTGLFVILKGLFTGNTQEISAGWRAFGQGLADIWHGLGNMLIGFLRATFMSLVALVSGFVMGVIQFFENLASSLVGHSIWPDMLAAMLNALITWIAGILSQVGSFIASVLSHFGAFGQLIVTLFQNYWNMVQNVFRTVLAAIQALLSGNFALFLQLIVSAGVQMVMFFVNTWTGMLRATIAGIASILTSIRSFIANIASIMANAAGQAFQWGVHLIQSMASGITSMVGTIVGAVSNVVGAIASHLHFTKPDVGELANYEEWMPHFGEGLAKGLNAQVAVVGAAAQNVAASIATASPTSSNFAGYTPSSISSNTDVVTVLQAILAELQTQTQAQKSGTGNNTTAQPMPSQNIGGTGQLSGGRSPSIAALYQQLNMTAGIASEYGVRGVNTGIGV